MGDLTGPVLPVIDWGEIFHIGVRVPDLEKAQQELTRMTGVHWTAPARLPMNVWDPRAGASGDCEITISFSVEGPTHIELIQGSPGSYWDAGNDGAGLHHFGAWVRDVARTAGESCPLRSSNFPSTTNRVASWGSLPTHSLKRRTLPTLVWGSASIRCQSRGRAAAARFRSDHSARSLTVGGCSRSRGTT